MRKGVHQSRRSTPELLGPVRVFGRKLRYFAGNATFSANAPRENRRRAIIWRVTIPRHIRFRGITGVRWYNVPVAGPPSTGHSIEQSQANSATKADHAHSHRTPAAQGTRAAPPAAPGRASQTPGESHGNLSKRTSYYSEPLVQAGAMQSDFEADQGETRRHILRFVGDFCL